MSNSYTHGELVDDLYGVIEECGWNVSRKAVNGLVNEMLSTWFAALQKGKSVNLNGIGTLKPIQLNNRMCRNPQTGELMITPAKKTVRFRPYRATKDALNKRSS